MPIKNNPPEQNQPTAGINTPQAVNQPLQEQIAASANKKSGKSNNTKTTSQTDSQKNNTIFTALLEVANSIKAALTGTNKTNAEIKKTLEEVSNKLSKLSGQTKNTSGPQNAFSDADVKMFLEKFEKSPILGDLARGLSSLNEKFRIYSESLNKDSSNIQQPSNQEIVNVLNALGDKIVSTVAGETSKLSDNFNAYIQSNFQQPAITIPEFPDFEKFMENSEARWSSVVDSLSNKFSESLQQINQRNVPTNETSGQETSAQVESSLAKNDLDNFLQSLQGYLNTEKTPAVIPETLKEKTDLFDFSQFSTKNLYSKDDLNDKWENFGKQFTDSISTLKNNVSQSEQSFQPQISDSNNSLQINPDSEDFDDFSGKEVSLPGDTTRKVFYNSI
jgi:hypothetical protein